ncbi:MAG: DNA primase [bacterium]|nr:DNA primase [bacterium]
MTPAEEIKSKLDIVEVIREYIQVKAVGVNFQARCPFHREKTPSFIVSPEKQIWRCFGCSKGGDVFDFVMEIEGLSFVEALRQLAVKAGVTLRRQGNQSAQDTSKRNRLLDVMDLSANYYHQLLLNSPAAASARKYLAERGLKKQIIEEFRIGFSLDSWDDLNSKLKKKGYSDEEIFLAGMSVKSDRGGKYYDRFRGRIMFPIRDVSGNTAAFTARVSPEKELTEKLGKYINSPQTALYDKSRMLFGLDMAKQTIREAGAAIIVEGQMDVISSFQAGVKNIVASSGTALSADQIKLIKRYTNNILFSFDIDDAGQIAAERGIEQGLTQDMNIRIIKVPGSKDPDECIRNNPRDWHQAIAGAAAVQDYYFEKIFTGRNIQDIQEKKEIAAKLLSVISRISSSIEKDSWVQQLASRLSINESVLRDVLNRKKTTQKNSAQASVKQTTEPVVKEKSHEEMLAESLLALLLRYSDHFEYVVERLMPAQLGSNIYQQFYKKLVIYYNKVDSTVFNYQQFRSWLHDHIEYEQELRNFEALVDTLSLIADRDFYAMGRQTAGIEIRKIIRQIKIKYYTQRMHDLEVEMSKAERGADEEKLKKIFDEFRGVVDEMKTINI